jgi:hypothetical protein
MQALEFYTIKEDEFGNVIKKRNESDDTVTNMRFGLIFFTVLLDINVVVRY